MSDEADYYVETVLTGCGVAFLVWYTGSVVRVLTDGVGRVLAYRDPARALERALCESPGARMDDGALDCRSVSLGADSPVDCLEAIDSWNSYTDVACSLGMPFFTDFDDPEIGHAHLKLTCGCNLPAMRGDGEEFVPEWSDAELRLLALVLNSGAVMLEQALAWQDEDGDGGAAPSVGSDGSEERGGSDDPAGERSEEPGEQAAEDPEFYVEKVILGGGVAFVPWYTDRVDGVPTDEEGRVPAFRDAGLALAWLRSMGIDARLDEGALDCRRISFGGGEDVDCEELTASWNFYVDVACSLGMPFFTDFDDPEIGHAHLKLTCGCNLPAMRGDGEEFVPEWSDAELRLLALVLNSGAVMLEQALSWRDGAAADAPSAGDGEGGGVSPRAAQPARPYPTGARSEYNKLKKYADLHFE